jgi:hypothetical protein
MDLPYITTASTAKQRKERTSGISDMRPGFRKVRSRELRGIYRFRKIIARIVTKKPIKKAKFGQGLPWPNSDILALPHDARS